MMGPSQTPLRPPCMMPHSAARKGTPKYFDIKLRSRLTTNQLSTCMAADQQFICQALT